MIDGINAATHTIDSKTPGGLKQAIESANDGDTIYLKNGAYNIDSFISISKNIKIKGQSNKVVLTGKTPTPLLMFGGTVKVSASLENLKITNTQEGAVGVINSKLTVKKCTFSNNKASSGGAIASVDATLSISDSIFTNNQAPHCAGAINVYSSKATVTNCIFKSNRANEEGGAISSGKSSLTVTKSSFNNNKAKKKGGAIYIWSATTLKVVDSKFSKNIAGKKYNAIDKDKKSKLTKKNVKITPKDSTKVKK